MKVKTCVLRKAREAQMGSVVNDSEFHEISRLHYELTRLSHSPRRAIQD